MGLRPINNVVDVTNYVLFATAQPIHSFDFGKLGGGKIVVRRARKGETPPLPRRPASSSSRPDMLVIADDPEADRPGRGHGRRGDRGLRDDPRRLHRERLLRPGVGPPDRQKTGLSTDASYRFERGTDIGFPPEAALMAASLLGGFGGQATQGLVDVYPKPRKPKSVVLRRRRVAELLGVEVPAE